MTRRVSTFILAVLAVAALAFAGPTVWAAAVPSNQGANHYYFEGTLDAANVVTADEQTAGAVGFAGADLIAFGISCTEDSGTASLDVALQRSIDGGTTWANIIAMTQLTATGAETKLYADLRAASAQFIGNRLRVNYDVTGTGQYTCSSYLSAEGQ